MLEFKIELELGDGRKWATVLHAYSALQGIELGRIQAAKEGYAGSSIGFATQLSRRAL